MNLSNAIVVLMLAPYLIGCDGHQASPLAPSPLTPPPSASPPSPPLASGPLVVFTEPGTGFSTTDLRDAQEQILQLTTGGELVWTADGTHLPGYQVERGTPPGGVPQIGGNICPERCWFEIRFGTRDGERRAYLTADYGHDNPGTLLDVDVVGGVLLVRQTSLFAPGTFTLSGVVSEDTPAGSVPVEGAKVHRGVTTGWRYATTDRNGFYQMLGMFDSTTTLGASKDGYVTENRSVATSGDTQVDIKMIRR